MDLLRAAWLECNVDVNPGRVLVLDYGKKVSSAHQVKCIYHDPSFLQIEGLQKGFEFWEPEWGSFWEGTERIYSRVIIQTNVNYGILWHF